MKKKKYSNIYFALFVCLAAVAVGSIVSVKTAITKIKPEETGFTRVTYKWTVPATEERVNAEQTGVEDNRLHSAEQSTDAIDRRCSGRAADRNSRRQRGQRRGRRR